LSVIIEVKNLVKITYTPWKEIIIHEAIQYSFEEFISMRSVGVPTGGLGKPLLWAEGIVFIRVPMPSSPDMVKENLEGRIHFSGIEWALMPQFRNFVEIKETKVKIPIINVSANAIFSEVAKWLKQSAKSLSLSSRIS
jgi:hypothetical protein